MRFALLLIILLSTMAQAEASKSFTGINILNDELIIASTKLEQDQMELISELMIINGHTFEMNKVSLPSELSGREVVGIFGGSKKNIYIFSQLTRGGGDNPLLHRYDLSSKSWLKIAELTCNSFQEVKTAADKILVTCVSMDGKGKLINNIKELNVPMGDLTKEELKLPLKEVISKSVNAKLLGEDFNWDKLKIKVGDKEKEFSL